MVDNVNAASFHLTTKKRNGGYFSAQPIPKVLFIAEEKTMTDVTLEDIKNKNIQI